MSRTRRLSLRARMLVLLIGVTTVLLLVMGTVSTYLLARRVDAQVAASSNHLINAVASLRKHGPQAAGDWGNQGTAVAHIAFPTPGLTITPTSPGALTNRLAAAVTTQLPGSILTHAMTLARDGQLTGAQQLLYGSGCG